MRVSAEINHFDVYKLREVLPRISESHSPYTYFEGTILLEFLK